MFFPDFCWVSFRIVWSLLTTCICPILATEVMAVNALWHSMVIGLIIVNLTEICVTYA